MLVLSRKRNETIVIGSNVQVTVLGVEGSRVKLGIEAPREVPVRRSEIPKAVVSPVRVPTVTVDTQPNPICAS